MNRTTQPKLRVHQNGSGPIFACSNPAILQIAIANAARWLSESHRRNRTGIRTPRIQGSIESNSVQFYDSVREAHLSSRAIYARFEIGEALNEFIDGWDRAKDHGRHLGVVIGEGVAAECRGNQPQ